MDRVRAYLVTLAALFVYGCGSAEDASKLVKADVGSKTVQRSCSADSLGLKFKYDSERALGVANLNCSISDSSSDHTNTATYTQTLDGASIGGCRVAYDLNGGDGFWDFVEVKNGGTFAVYTDIGNSYDGVSVQMECGR